MVKGMLLVVLFMSVAQVLPGCGGDQGGGAELVGWVEEKRHTAADRWVVLINGLEYPVPYPFYRNVEVGDLVKWDGQVWTIVRKAGAPQS